MESSYGGTRVASAPTYSWDDDLAQRYLEIEHSQDPEHEQERAQILHLAPWVRR